MTPPLGKRLAATVMGFGLLAAAAILTAPLVGSTPISLAPRLRSTRFRLPTTSTRKSSSSRGCHARWPAPSLDRLLASAGVVFQGLLRNPLATPFTLGVSAGAALGAMLAITFSWSFAWAGVSAARRRQLHRFAGRGWHRLRARPGAAPRPVDQRAAAWPASR